jgi:ribosomal protein S18 acetylase RimI-like enzyme
MPSEKLVEPVTRQSCRQAARVLGAAFVDEPVSQVIYKGFSPEKRLRNLVSDFTVEMSACLRHGAPLQVRDQGRVVASAVIYQPGSYPLPRFEQAWISVRSILGHDLYDLRPWWRWLAETDRLHPQEAHYYLEYLGVLPEYQGQGFGSAILQLLTARADEGNAGCYLETATPINVPLYRRHGFEVMAERTIIGLNTWFMWRPPPA